MIQALLYEFEVISFLVLIYLLHHSNFKLIFFSIDINECGTFNGGCEQTCNNTQGSYHCSCWNGYSLGTDQHNCSGKNSYCVIILLHHNNRY